MTNMTVIKYLSSESGEVSFTVEGAPTAKYPWWIWLIVATGALSLMYAVSRR
jgi:hypothetical protein